MPAKIILPGQGDTLNVMSPLIPFNLIIDTDFGLLCLIKQRYLDESVFDEKFFKNKSVRNLVSEIYSRKEKNPLYLFIKDEYKDSADKFYNQFMEREYDSILNLSATTEFYRLARMFSNEPEIKVTIVCNTQKEFDLLSSHKEGLGKCRLELKSDLDNVKLGIINQYFFKCIDDYIEYKKWLKNKTVYFANYSFNVDELESGSEELLDIMSNNRISIIDIYDRKKLGGNNETELR